MNEIRMVKFDGLNYVIGHYIEKSESVDSHIQWESGEPTGFGIPLSTFQNPFNSTDENICPSEEDGALYYPEVEAFVFGESKSAQERVRSFWGLDNDEELDLELEWDVSSIITGMVQDFENYGIPTNDIESLMRNSFKLSSDEYDQFLSEFLGYWPLSLVTGRHGDELRFFPEPAIREHAPVGLEVLKVIYEPELIRQIFIELPQDRILRAKSLPA
jgi:hypothetical protein